MTDKTKGKMEKKTLNVKAVGVALVQNFEALEEGSVRRFINRTFDASAGEHGGWIPKEESDKIPDRAEYRHAVKIGDLEAADEATAKCCGVRWTCPEKQIENQTQGKTK